MRRAPQGTWSRVLMRRPEPAAAQLAAPHPAPASPTPPLAFVRGRPVLAIVGQNAPTTATNLRLALLAYVGPLIPFIAAILPRDVRAIWAWVFVGGGLLLVAAGLGFHDLRAAFGLGDPPATTSPVRILVQNAVMYGAISALAYGLSGPVGFYRIALLGPLLLIAVIGNDVLFGVSFLMCMICLGTITAGSGFDLTQFPGYMAAFGGGFLITALFVRELAQSSIRGIRRSETFARISESAALTEDLDGGVRMITPFAGQYLEADSLAIFRVHGRRLASAPTATWPADELILTANEESDLRIAVVERHHVVRDDWTCLPVMTTNDVSFVVLARRPAPEILERRTYEQSLQRLAVQLGVLQTRLDLIERLEGLTKTDTLTELPNRRALTERLEQETAKREQADSVPPLSVAMVDLDHFKAYNDTFGHLAGDELLRDVAAMLRERLRDTDLAARYGGEEFCLVLPATTESDALVVVEELHRRARELPIDCSITFSAGVAQWDCVESPDELLHRADMALYEAKRSGRNHTRQASAPISRTEQAVANHGVRTVR